MDFNNVNWWLVVIALLISAGAIVGGFLTTRNEQRKYELREDEYVAKTYMYGDGSSGL